MNEILSCRLMLTLITYVILYSSLIFSEPYAARTRFY